MLAHALADRARSGTLAPGAVRAAVRGAARARAEDERARMLEAVETATRDRGSRVAVCIRGGCTCYGKTTRKLLYREFEFSGMVDGRPRWGLTYAQGHTQYARFMTPTLEDVLERYSNRLIVWVKTSCTAPAPSGLARRRYGALNHDGFDEWRAVVDCTPRARRTRPRIYSQTY